MQGLLEVSRAFLEAARKELEEGLLQGNQLKVRQAAEKGWNAVVQATDYAMQVRGRVPVPGRGAHQDRRDFLEEIGRGDLAEKYTYFAERLHGDVFYSGATLPVSRLRQYMDEVRDYIDRLATY